jgi:MoaA/NifB/PqqE/SkfB family radical SAM enzyme
MNFLNLTRIGDCMNKPLKIKNTHNRLFRRNQNMPDQNIDEYLVENLNLPLTNIDNGKPKSGQDKFLMDGNKMLWHLDRLEQWKKGEKFAPIHIDAGLSKGCNIQCHYCYGVTQGNFYKSTAKNYFERDALIYNYMKSAGEVGVRSIAFIGEAEPTLNPHLYEAVIVGKNSGIDMSIGTNGVLFDSGKRGKAALEHLSWIRFNISAASDESYRKIHASKEFDTVIEKVKFCVDYKRKKNLDLSIGLQMVLTPKDVAEVVPLAKLGSELEVDYFQVKHCSDTVENDLGIFERLDDYKKFEPLLKVAESYGNEDYSVIIKWDKITNEGHRDYDQCLGAPFLLYTEGTGKVYTCGMFFEGKYENDYLLGDLNTHTFKDILESDHYWKIINKVKNEIDVHKDCYANCRTHSCNNFIWDAKEKEIDSQIVQNNSGGYTKSNPPPHVNFV